MAAAHQQEAVQHDRRNKATICPSTRERTASATTENNGDAIPEAAVCFFLNL